MHDACIAFLVGLTVADPTDWPLCRDFLNLDITFNLLANFLV